MKRESIHAVRPATGRERSCPFSSRQVASSAALFTRCTADHSLSSTSRRSGRSVLTARSGVLTSFFFRRVVRPQTLTPR
jgi:hypothetical protein